MKLSDTQKRRHDWNFKFQTFPPKFQFQGETEKLGQKIIKRALKRSRVIAEYLDFKIKFCSIQLCKSMNQITSYKKINQVWFKKQGGDESDVGFQLYMGWFPQSSLYQPQKYFRRPCRWDGLEYQIIVGFSAFMIFICIIKSLCFNICFGALIRYKNNYHLNILDVLSFLLTDKNFVASGMIITLKIIVTISQTVVLITSVSPYFDCKVKTTISITISSSKAIALKIRKSLHMPG